MARSRATVVRFSRTWVMKNIILPPAPGARRQSVPVIGSQTYMENEAFLLRVRAEQAKLNALYSGDETERLDLEGRARAYAAHAQELEDTLDGWNI
jgi:hypothetical protein